MKSVIGRLVIPERIIRVLLQNGLFSRLFPGFVLVPAPISRQSAARPVRIRNAARLFAVSALLGTFLAPLASQATVRTNNDSFSFVTGSPTVLPMGTLFFDDFTRNTDPTNLTAPWAVESGNWMVTGGALQGSVTTVPNYAYAYLDTNWAEYSVQARIQFSNVTGFGGGVGGRLNPATGAHYAAWIYPDSSSALNSRNSVALIKFQDWQDWGYQGSNFTPMQQVSLPGVGTNWHTLKLAFQANRILVYVDGNKMIDTTDAEAQPYQTGGITADMWADNPDTMAVDDVDVALPTVQTITFASIPNHIYGNAPFTVSATADSGLPVSLNVISGPATIVSNLVTITGAGTVTIEASQPGGGNYDPAANVDQTFNIQAAALTVAANDAGKTYGQAVNFAGTEFSVTGLFSNDTLTGVALASDGAAASAGVSGSPYAIIPSSAVGVGLSNYTITYVNGTLTVNPAMLTITVNSLSKIYGQTVAFSGDEITASGLVNGDSITSVTLASDGAAATASVAGLAYPIAPSAAIGTGLTNYAITYANGSLTVNPAPLIVTANGASKTYGQTVSFAGTEFTAAGLLNSDSITSVTLASDGAAATATVAGSAYPIVPSAAVGSGLANYAITYASGALAIAPAQLTGQVLDASRAYGDTNPVFSVNYTGFSNNEDATAVTGPMSFTCVDTNTNAVDTNSHIGAYPIHVATGQSAANYAISYVDGTLTVNPAALLVSAQSFSRLYGSTNPFPTPLYLGLVNGEDSSVLAGRPGFEVQADVTSPVGSYPIVVGQGTLSNANYSLSFSNATLTVTVLALSASADNQTMAYGQALPTLTGSLTGVANGDNISVTYKTAATPASAVGTYDIVPVLSDPNHALTNYTVSLINGTLTVNPATLTVTANDTTKTYGQTVSFAGTEFNTAGLVNGDSVTSVTLVSDGAAVTASVAGSAYPIVPRAAVGVGLSNYTVTYANGSLTVSPANLMLSANNASRAYGLPNPTCTGDIGGLLNGDNITASYTTAAGQASPVGVYNITPVAVDGGGVLVNYSVEVNPGTLTITAAASSITWTNPTDIVYGMPLTDVQLNAIGSVPGTLVYTPATGTILAVSNAQPLSVTLVPDDTNYAGSSTVVFINVLQAQATGSVVSSTNPALPGASVTFTDNLTAVAPGAGMPTGSVQFTIDGSMVGAPVPVVNGSASFSTSSLGHGTHSVAAAYSGDTNFLGATNTLAAQQVINTPPIAPAYTISTMANTTITFSTDKLLDDVTDPDGDAVSLTAVTPNDTNGGHASLKGETITYAPAYGATSNQSFTYTVVDSLGGTATGMVTVAIIRPSALLPATPSVTVMPNGSALLALHAQPGATYILQGSADLTTWVNLGQVTAGPDGLVRVEDGDAPNYSARYYRLVYP